MLQKYYKCDENLIQKPCIFFEEVYNIYSKSNSFAE